MSITVVFFLGLFVALVGVIPPGLLNMTAAKISLKEGPGRGITFSSGVCLVVFIQTYLAAIFARYLSNRPDIVEILQRVAFVIFVLITIYFLVIARNQKETNVEEADVMSKQSRFFHGMLLSALNVFPIPYQAYMTITLSSFGWMNFEKTSIVTYVTGAAMGTFVMLYFYIFFFDKIKDKKFTSQKSMNYSIGIITGLVALVTLINILKEL
ncbi:MAG: lysine transporter LysE [Winogradskyella sp.]|uniref:LysE family transporter n=1 Tax=Winogradskyella poriferorum TaxID=307627 RepID=A0ABU7W1N1_9FLAO|nr:LysE family transporter [Winogradskyella sp. MH6]MAB48356.1 lysine transporter LysE [Flavobacteriaceae bacterium]MAX70127.1 lysine transporter LysE [Flavobacteriaceae bacterium]MBL85801.1 lysine transporter LysE [Winogradskyella sp.]